MEELLKQLLEGQKRLEGHLDKMKDRFDKVESFLGKMGVRVDTADGQLQENAEYLEGLMHQSEYQKAQTEQVVNTMARLEGEIRNIRFDLHGLEAITAKNWNDIIQLRVPK